MTLMLAGMIAIAGSSAHAQYNPQSIGTFKDWAAWVDSGGAAKICFIASKPTKSLPKGVNRGEIYIYVTHRPAQNIRGEVAIRIGYPFKKNEEGIIRIGNREFGLEFDGERGWPVPASEDPRVVSAMKAGSTMTLQGLSSRGTKTTDTFSLLGFTAAFNAMTKACK